MDSRLPLPPSAASDIFSLSDQVLSDKLCFLKEIGFGNWGSVWLCRPKGNPSSPSADGLTKLQDIKLAVKLVHRSKSDTSRKRVQSLWNEMKIVRSFKNDPHPSIIPFHSFVITPSYALITMAYVPTLIPVEVDETRAKPWFRSLLSGVEFLHKRGVVHNDIKPANILVNEDRAPVLVDFGFAEKYDITSDTAFHSNLHYGTPEYLSPERARGLPHDTRKSDIWSLGITFFEILVGRTPFEYSEGEEFCTHEDMQRYWGRTLKGKWVGTWNISKGVEKMLRRMVAPNADLRCNAADAMSDAYWGGRPDPVPHKRSASVANSLSPSVVLDKEMSKLMDVSLPWSNRSSSKSKEKENSSRPAKDKENQAPRPIAPVASHSRSKSQPKIAPKVPVQPRKRPAVPPLFANLSPVKASPPGSPVSPTMARGKGKENANGSVKVISLNSTSALPARKPISTRPVLSPVSTNLPPAPSGDRTSAKDKIRDVNKRGGGLRDFTGMNNRNVGHVAMVVKEKPKAKPKAKETVANISGSESVRKRVKEWEREKERLREMERLEQIGKERDVELETARRMEDEAESTTDISVSMMSSPGSSPEKEQSIQVAKVAVRASAQMVSATPSFLDLSTTPTDELPQSVNGSGFSLFRQGLKMSIDKGVRMCKTSTLVNMTGRSTPAKSPSGDGLDEPQWMVDRSERESWEDDIIDCDDLPGLRQAMRDERDIAEDARIDRMTLWMRNVDKVVEDARQNFASASAGAPQPPLPIPPPMSRSSSQANRSSRLPRKVLTASQIFSSDGSLDQTGSSFAFVTAENISRTVDKTLPSIPAEDLNRPLEILAASTPPRPRRATITTRSPEAVKTKASFDLDTGSPSKRKEKSKSYGNFLRPIQTIDRLELELQKETMPTTSPRLSAFLDSSLFIASPTPPTEEETAPAADITLPRSKSLDLCHLTSSPVHIEPYPPRKSDVTPPTVDTPGRRKQEKVYDRFLMATSGVKRVGRGYQSDNAGPVQSTPHPQSMNPTRHHIHNHRVFNTARRAMPPPVSSDDLKSPVAVDEFGLVTCKAGSNTPVRKDDSNNTVAFVRRAFKAVVTGKTVTRRLSRTAVA